MKLNSVLTLLFIALFTACKGGAYDLSGYGLKPDTGENASPLIAKALQEIAAEVNSDTVRILLPKGRYDFYPEGASKREYFISNHDQDNPKLVGLAFENMKNVIFDGQGSELVFHGRMLPVSLVGSENCTLKNFSIDFANPHISQVKVLENDTVGGLITYEVAPWVEYEIRDSNFVAKGEGWEHVPAWGIAFEGDTKRLVYTTSDISVGSKHVAEIASRKILAPWKNKKLIPGEVIAAIINGTDELLAELREMGVGVYATGGETADVGDLVRTIIVDSTVTCRMKRSDVIDNANIRPGDVIVGLASYGQATYEKEYNGGMGSNGLTSARHDVFSKYLAEKYPESYDKAVPEELVYSGGLKLTDAVEDSPLDAGKLVLSPTRTYAPVVKKLLDALRPEIHGMVHCSGGAQTKVLHFIGDNCRVIKDNLFPVPPLFKTIKEQSNTDWAEMYKVFNMGHRLEVYLSPEHAEEVIAISKSFGIDAQIVGRIEESNQKELIINSEFGEFKY